VSPKDVHRGILANSMADYVFECGGCGQQMSGDETMHGQLVSCLFCGAHVLVPAEEEVCSATETGSFATAQVASTPPPPLPVEVIPAPVRCEPSNEHGTPTPNVATRTQKITVTHKSPSTPPTRKALQDAKTVPAATIRFVPTNPPPSQIPTIKSPLIPVLLWGAVGIAILGAIFFFLAGS